MIYIIGLGPGTSEYMTQGAVDALSSVNAAVGGRRLLEIAELPPEARRVELPASGMADAVIGVLSDEADKGDVALLVSGDPGFYSLAKKVTEHFGRKNVRAVPGISSLQIMAARLGRSWVNAASFSLHGRELPDRSCLSRSLLSSPALVILLGASDEAAAHIRWLAEDDDLGLAWAAVGWDLGLPKEQVFEGENLRSLLHCPYVGRLALLWLEKTGT
jgi:precorrin-6y C5,15-methyltransferase (decarboxylating) CbiE subunit